jgi:hypothetical protein
LDRPPLPNTNKHGTGRERSHLRRPAGVINDCLRLHIASPSLAAGRPIVTALHPMPSRTGERRTTSASHALVAAT